MNSAGVFLLFAFSSFSLILAHSCEDNERVQCMEVVLPNYLFPAVSGSNYCTSDGVLVECLVGHDYHKCQSSSQLPCCMDGSVPSRGNQDSRRRSNGQSDGQSRSPSCGGAVATPAPNATTTAAGHNETHDDDAAASTSSSGTSSGNSSNSSANYASGPVAAPGADTSEASVLLSVGPKSAGGLEGAPMNKEDTLLKLQKHSQVIRNGLAHHLGLVDEKVLILAIAPGSRRLQGCYIRDCPLVHSYIVLFSIPTTVWQKLPEFKSDALVVKLQAALDAANLEFAVQSAAIDWPTKPSMDSPHVDNTWGMIPSVVAAVAITCGMLCGVLAIRRRCHPCWPCGSGAKNLTGDKDLEPVCEPVAIGIPVSETWEKPGKKLDKGNPKSEFDETASEAPSTSAPSDFGECCSIGSKV